MTQIQNSEMDLPARSVEVLKAIKENGGFICTGSCKQIKKGQLHCRNLGNMLGMTPSSIWVVINALNAKGLIFRHSDNPITLKLTDQGEEMLSQAGK